MQSTSKQKIKLIPDTDQKSYYLGELTEHGIIRFHKSKFLTKTDVINCIDAMVRNNPNEYEAAY